MLNLPNEHRRKPLEISVNEQGCQLITSRFIDRDGHVQIRVNGVYEYAHRLSYEQTYGSIPSGMIVRHKCDNGNCINPEHLELGTHADNVEDRVNRKRSATGKRNGRTKLTEEQAKFIKYDTEHKNSELAEKFDVDRRTISLIKSGKNWSYL